MLTARIDSLLETCTPVPRRLRVRFVDLLNTGASVIAYKRCTELGSMDIDISMSGLFTDSITEADVLQKTLKKGPASSSTPSYSDLYHLVSASVSAESSAYASILKMATVTGCQAPTAFDCSEIADVYVVFSVPDYFILTRLLSSSCTPAQVAHVICLTDYQKGSSSIPQSNSDISTYEAIVDVLVPHLKEFSSGSVNLENIVESFLSSKGMRIVTHTVITHTLER